MVCSSCKHTNPSDAVYCENCGYDLSSQKAGIAAPKRATMAEASPFVPPPVNAPSAEFWKPSNAQTPVSAGVPKRATMMESMPSIPPVPRGEGGSRDPFAASAGIAPLQRAAPPQQNDPFAGAVSAAVAPKKNATLFDGGIGGNPAAPIAGTAVKQGAPAPTTDRRLIGWLVTFSNQPMGRAYEIREGKNSIGRAPTCEVSIEDGKISAVHACIQNRGGRTWIYDENSSNGTHVNNNDIFQEKPTLGDGDVVRLGNTILLVKLITPEQAVQIWGESKG